MQHPPTAYSKDRNDLKFGMNASPDHAYDGNKAIFGFRPFSCDIGENPRVKSLLPHLTSSAVLPVGRNGPNRVATSFELGEPAEVFT